jgi:hypothetical protein
VERLLFKILSGAHEPIATLRPDLPLDVQRTVHRALARRASDRFGGVSELALALRSLDLGGGANQSTVRDERREAPVARPALSGRRTLQLGVVAMVAALGGAMLLSSRTPGHTTGPARNAETMLLSAKEGANTSSSNAVSTTEAQTAPDVQLSAVAVPAELERPLTREPKLLAAPPLVKARARRVDGTAPGGPRDSSNGSVAPVPEIRIEVQNPYAR